MPRVPTYDGLQIGAATLPQARLAMPDAPDAGRNAQAMGRSMQQAGSHISNIALDMAQQAAQVKINDLANKAIAERLRLTYDPEAGYVHKKGQAAIAGPDGKPMTQDYQERYDKFLSELESELTNDWQRQQLREQAMAWRNQFQNGLTAHTAREFGNFKSSVNDGTVKLALEQMALAWGDAQALQQATDAIGAAVVEQGKLKGLSALETQANLLATLTQGHRAVAAAAIDAGQLDYAEKYLKQHGSEISATDKDKLGAVLRDAKRATHAQEVVDALIQGALKRAGPDARIGSALPLAQMKQRLREQLGGDPAALAMGEDLMARRHKELVAAQKEQDEQTLDSVYKQLFANGGNMTALPAELQMRIPGEKLGAVMDFAKKAGATLGQANDALAWAQVQSLPKDALANMTPVDFYRQFRPHLDDAHLEKGYALIKAAQGTADERHLEIVATSQRVREAAIAAGIFPRSAKPDDKQLQALADFERSVDEEVRRFERIDLAGKRRANTDELQKILDEKLMDRVSVQRGWPGMDYLAPDDHDQVLSTLSPEDQQKAYVRVGGQEIRLVSIPAGQRAQIIQSLRRAGQRPTEQAIAEFWVRAGKPKD